MQLSNSGLGNRVGEALDFALMWEKLTCPWAPGAQERISQQSSTAVGAVPVAGGDGSDGMGRSDGDSDGVDGMGAVGGRRGEGVGSPPPLPGSGRRWRSSRCSC